VQAIFGFQLIAVFSERFATALSPTHPKVQVVADLTADKQILRNKSEQRCGEERLDLAYSRCRAASPHEQRNQDDDRDRNSEEVQEY
jgi:hypothetical protein